VSERKTAEIKLRVTPSFKAAVQLAAETAGETMSVYMEKATQDRMNENGFPANDAARRQGWSNVIGGQFPTNINPVTPVAPTAVPASRNDNAEQWVSGGHEKFEVPAKSDKVACEKNCPSWVFCQCKSGWQE